MGKTLWRMSRAIENKIGTFAGPPPNGATKYNPKLGPEFVPICTGSRRTNTAIGVATQLPNIVGVILVEKDDRK